MAKTIPGCDLLPSNPVTDTVCGVADAAVDKVTDLSTPLQFATDPFGYTAQQIAKGSSEMAAKLLPAIHEITTPDLSVGWFKQAYTLTWTLGLMAMSLLLIWNFFLLARDKVSTQEVLETFTVYLPAWFFGCSLGPAFAQYLLGFMGALNKTVWQFPGFGGGEQLVASGEYLGRLAALGGSTGILGGPFISIILGLVMMLALLLILIVFIVMLLTLYFAGIIFPLFLVWVLKPKNRAKGLKSIFIWLGILTSQLLIMVGLSMAMSMTKAGLTLLGDKATEDEGIGLLIQLMTGSIAIFFAVTAPFIFVQKFGGIIGDSNDSSIDHQGNQNPISPIGPAQPTNSQTSQLSTQTGDSRPGTSDPTGSSERSSEQGTQRLVNSSNNTSQGTNSQGPSAADSTKSNSKGSTTGAMADANSLVRGANPTAGSATTGAGAGAASAAGGPAAVALVAGKKAASKAKDVTVNLASETAKQGSGSSNPVEDETKG